MVFQGFPNLACPNIRNTMYELAEIWQYKIVENDSMNSIMGIEIK
jgi:hypothetical protein